MGRINGKDSMARRECLLCCLGSGTIEGVVVESTYNWYWLVDGLMADGYAVHLAILQPSRNIQASSMPMTNTMPFGWPRY